MLVEADNPEAIAGPLREVVRGIDPAMQMFTVRTMDDLYQSRGVKVPQTIVGTVGGLGAMGVGLALVGLYGLVSYAVNRRTREIGIRMAVGARPRAVLAMVLRRGLTLTLAGMALGAIGSILAGQALQSAIPGVGDFGPRTYALAVPAVLAVTVLAAYIPSRRAARIDPLRAIRTE